MLIVHYDAAVSIWQSGSKQQKEVGAAENVLVDCILIKKTVQISEILMDLLMRDIADMVNLFLSLIELFWCEGEKWLSYRLSITEANTILTCVLDVQDIWHIYIRIWGIANFGIPKCYF